MFVEELFTSECSDYIIELNHCSIGAMRHQESSSLSIFQLTIY